MITLYPFGDNVKTYQVPVLNEREVRSSAGILFVLAFISFMNAFLLGDFFLTKLFVTLFLIDFTIRLFINYRYSPSIVIGRIIVQNQTPEYVSAKPKRFAWMIGFFLSLIMFVVLVALNTVGPVNLLICVICLPFLLFESAFGICLGCVFYKKFYPTEIELCAGNVCEIKEKEPIQKIKSTQLISIILVPLIIMSLVYVGLITKDITGFNPHEQTDCNPPEWAIDMGHEEMWKSHNCQ
jgi:hypothetical protein